MALFIGSTIVVLCMVQVSLTHRCWDQLGDDLDPKLLGYLAKRDPFNSFAISGHSLVTPLEMLYYAAAGETQKQLAKALELQPGQEKNSACESELQIIGKYREANKLFLDKQFPINVFYEQEIKKVLHSEIGSVNFSDEKAATETINKWVRHKTDNKINNIVSPWDLGPDTTAVIANTFLLESEWAKPFNVKNTKERDFYVAEKLQFMRIRDWFRVRELKSMDAMAVYIPMREAKANMVLILPNKVNGLQKVLESLSRNEILKGSILDAFVLLSLPKFAIETTTDMTDFLKSIGVIDIFTSKSELPDLTRNGTKIIIDEFLQRSVIEIDEKGVNAATANKNNGDSSKVQQLSSKTNCDLPFEHITMKFNHPFYYGFTESYESEKIYFGGVFRG